MIQIQCKNIVQLYSTLARLRGPVTLSSPLYGANCMLIALHMLHCEVFITPPANVQINISKRHTCVQQSFTENYVFFLFVQQYEFCPILLLVKGKRKLVECTSRGGVNDAQ